ncbi:MAG TPA: hypothetical protein VMX74_09530 [Pirellulales bacterium]|nr:hypothetical protein [Pirellulales bacterium]
MIRSLVCLVGLGAFLLTATSEAQDDVLVQLYGQGVHEYFSGQYHEAQKNLSAAIDSGSRDPRAYYYRGLVNQRLGYEGAASEDFKMGADLEVRTGVSEAVGRALTRIQGQDRMAVEKHRTDARLVLQRERSQRRRDRYEDAPDRGAAVEDLDDGSLEDDLQIPDDEDTAPDLLEDSDDAAPVEAPDDTDNLFEDVPAKDATDEPAADDGDLFSDDEDAGAVDDGAVDDGAMDDDGAVDDGAVDDGAVDDGAVEDAGDAGDAGDPFGDDPGQPGDAAGGDAADGDAGDAGDGGAGGDDADEIEDDPF